MEEKTEKQFNIVDKLFSFMSDVNNYDLDKMYEHEFTVKTIQGETVTYGYDENGFGIKEPGNQSYNFLEMMGKAQMNKSKSTAQMSEDILNAGAWTFDKLKQPPADYWQEIGAGMAMMTEGAWQTLNLITGGGMDNWQNFIQQYTGRDKFGQEGESFKYNKETKQFDPISNLDYTLDNRRDVEGLPFMTAPLVQYGTLGVGMYTQLGKIPQLATWGKIILAELGMEFVASTTREEDVNLANLIGSFGYNEETSNALRVVFVESLKANDDDEVFERKAKNAIANAITIGIPVSFAMEGLMGFFRMSKALKHDKKGRQEFAESIGLTVTKDDGLDGVFKVTNKEGDVIASFDREDLANSLVESLGEEYVVQNFKSGGASVVVPDNINKVPLDKLNKSEQAFYSNVVNAIQKIDIPEKGINSEQLLNTIKNQPGVKQSEIDDMGLETFLAENPIVTKTQIDEFVEKKALTNKVNTKILGEKTDENNRLAYPDDQMDIPEPLKGLEDIDDAKIILDNDEGLFTRFNDWVDDTFEQDFITRRNNDELSEVETDSLIREFLRVEYNINTFNPTSKTFFGKHTLPGGKDYTELLISSNGTAQVYRGDKHFSKTGSIPSGENLLAHVRFNTRTINGKKTLFIEELQSDLHQAGRKEGYVGGQTDLQKKHQELIEKMDKFDDVNKSPTNTEYMKLYDEFQEVAKSLDIENRNTVKKVPNAPFKKNWHELAMKRIIKYAIDNDFEAISFTPSSVQIERYDLSKHIDQLFYNEKTGSIHGYKNGETVLFQQDVTKDNLADYVGKEIAERLINAPVEKATQIGAENIIGKRLTGLDLKVGGEGMIGFYDKMLPSFINKFVKKYKTKLTNAKLTDVPVFEGGKYNYRNTKLKDAKNLNEMHDLVINDDYLNKEFMLYLRDELNELDPDSLIKNANQDEIKGYINEFLEDDYGLNPDQLWDTENIDLINAPFLEITPEMKMDIYEKGVPIAKVKKKKVNQQSTRMA
tara:strand:- start:2083 stop:5058 length:2976 start_codon:yes stop_codon:yes gene_type:complete